MSARLQQRDAGVGLQPRDVLVGRVQHHVDLARGQRGQPRGVGLDGDPAHLLQVAVARVGPAPPAVVAAQQGAHVGLVALQPHRAGAVGVADGVGLLLGVEVLRLRHAVLLAPGLAHDRHELQLLGQHGVGRLELDLHASAGRACAPRSTPLSWKARCEGGAIARSSENTTSSAVKGVPSWKLDARAQPEAPARGRRHLPGHGQRRLELELLVAADQRLVDLEHHARVVQQRQRMRVHGLRVEGRGDAQRGGVRGAAGQQEQREGQARRAKPARRRHERRVRKSAPGRAGGSQEVVQDGRVVQRHRVRRVVELGVPLHAGHIARRRGGGWLRSCRPPGSAPRPRSRAPGP